MLPVVDNKSYRRESCGDTRQGNNMSASALRSMEDATMVLEFDAGGFINLSREQRIAKCREMATEAERLAAGKSSEMRASYLDLSRKWIELADEMENLRDA
jgi:hypothetical protein